jgi:hypothetical protein
MPRTEFFLAAGGTVGSPAVLGQHPTWVTIQGGGAYCVTRSIGVGIATGWSFIGSEEILYMPPGGDFTSAKETIAMVPAIGYLKLRLPVGSGGSVPYITAGAGSYTLLASAKPEDGPRSRDTQFGVTVAIGLAGRAGRFSRLIEARYDARSVGQGSFGQIRSESRLDMFTVSLGLQLP